MEQEWIMGWALIGSGVVFILLVNYLTKYWDRLKEKFKSIGFKEDYQLELLSALVVMGLAFVFFFPVVGWMMHNIPALIGFLVVVCYPIGVMILRPVTFEKVLKIIPDFRIYRIFVVFSFIAGGYFTIAGFSMLNFHYPLELIVIMILIGLIGQTIPLLPDYTEKITKFDLGMNRQWRMNKQKSQKALIVLGVLSIVTFLILRFVTESIQSKVFGI